MLKNVYLLHQISVYDELSLLTSRFKYIFLMLKSPEDYCCLEENTLIPILLFGSGNLGLIR